MGLIGSRSLGQLFWLLAPDSWLLSSIKHVVHRLRMFALAKRFVGQLLAAVEIGVGPGREGLLFANNSDATKPCLLEKRVEMPHHRERFNPWHRARSTTGPDEVARQTGPTIGRVDHHTGEDP